MDACGIIIDSTDVDAFQGCLKHLECVCASMAVIC